MTDRHAAIVAASGLRVDTGGRAHGFLPVAGFESMAVPLVLIRGASPGPVAVVIAGVHGGEYNGIEATRRLGHDLDPTRASGVIALVPLANRPAFHARSHNGAPPDGQNLGRVFPGVAGGKALERVAHVITTSLIQHADLVLDLHGGDALEDLADHLYVPPMDVPATRPWSSWDLAEVYGIELVERVPAARLEGSAAGAAATLGIPSILPESGAFGHLREECVQAHYQGVVNVLRRVGVLEGRPAPAHPARPVRHASVHSPATGFFYAKVRAGDHVAAGQTIAEITDYFGTTTTAVTAPVAGVIDFIKYSLATNKGDSLFHVAAPASQAAPAGDA